MSYDGTIRVECHSNGRTASGDLYQRPAIFLPPLPIPFPGPLPRPQPRRPFLLPGPNPANGIPILSRSRYRYYLRITQLLENFTVAQSFTLGFEMWRFTASNSWTNEGSATAEMRWTTAPTGYPSPSDYLEGDVVNSAGVTVGRLTMGWVSSYLRKATVEIDRVSRSEAPLNSGAGHDWRSIFDEIGWDLNLIESDSDVTEPSGESWSDAEMHAAMPQRRDSADLDSEWRYHLICVRRLDSTSRGIMYDAFGTDSNNVPREGAGIASHWPIPNADPWGLVKGKRFGAATAPYFRTAVHELGHALGLFHNTIDNGFMNTTGVIAAAGTATTPFPNNVKWQFADDDLKRLRHYPDPFVRPGMVPFGDASTSTPPISPTDLEIEVTGLTLKVTPLKVAVPIGAPVRVMLELSNDGDQPIDVPESLSLKHGAVRGYVIDPSGTRRSFVSLMRCVEDHEFVELKPGKTMAHDMTLLRGAEGALFPAAGIYTVVVDVFWEVGGMEAVVRSDASVMVEAATDEKHAEAAAKILATPDAHLVLVLGGDHLEEGVEAFKTALDDPTLRPHFAYSEARRKAQRFGKRRADVSAAAELIDDSTVMSPAELEDAAEIARKIDDKTAAGKKLKKCLKTKSKELPMPQSSAKVIEDL
ncbi:MAG: hypothetical protein R3F54_21560 [Alphaproteobacteria bacterium]